MGVKGERDTCSSGRNSDPSHGGGCGKRMDVSVVIPTYNRPELLRETIACVLRQTVAPREIIVVDDGMGDDTRQMIEANYAGAVIYLREAHQGVQVARNMGIARAQGSWIATLDDDDLRHPQFLEQFVPAIADGRASLIYSDHRKFIDRDGVSTAYPQTNFDMAPSGYWDGVPDPAEGQHWSFAGKFPPERILQFNAFYPSTMLARRDLIQAIGGFQPQVRGMKAEDIEFLIRALIAGDLAVVWLPLVDYRIHQTNVSGGDWVSQMIGRWHVFEYIRAQGAYGCEPLLAALEKDLPLRRAKTFDQAWRHSRFDVIDELGPLLRAEDWTLLRRLRMKVRGAPAPLRSTVMYLRDALAVARGAGVSAAGPAAPKPSLAASAGRTGLSSAASIPR